MSSPRATERIISDSEALKLARLSGPSGRLVRYYFEPYCDDLLGTLGTHQRLVVESTSPDDVRSYFVKAVPYDDPTETAYVRAKGVFESECLFFAELAPLLHKHASQLEPWAPECYLVKPDALVFEDLGVKGYSLRGPLFDQARMKSALGAVARLHASSILAEVKLGSCFADLYPDAFREMTYNGEGKTHGWCQAGIDAAVVVADSLGLDSSKIRGLYQSLLDKVSKEKSKTRRLGNGVLSHGDLWANNLMFDASGEHCRLVDFQFVRYAPLAQDLALLLHLSASRELRRSCEDELVLYYHTCLCEALHKCEPKLELPTLQQLQEGLRAQQHRAVVSAVIYASSVFISRKFAAEVIDDPEAYQKFQYRDRREKIFQLMRADEFYRRRIEDTVRDVVEFGEGFRDDC